MGRLSSIQKLPPEVRIKVDSLLSAHPHCTLDQLLALLGELELNVCSRSGLQRYLADRRSHARASIAETIITVVEPRTGSVRIIRTTANADLVEAALSKLASCVVVA